jgi:site-specific DNA recombinase
LQKKGYKKRLKNKQDEWIVIPDAHPAIISREEFQEVQEKISKRGEKIFRGRGKKALFARLAFCADCGAGMNYKNDRKGYVCATYQKNGKQKCQSHYIKHSDLKDKVLADLRDLATDSLYMKALLDIALKRAGTKKLEAMEELKRVEREFESLQAEKRELLRLLTRQVITQRDYEEQYQIINNEQTALEQQKRALEDTLSKEVDTETNIHAFQAEIRRFINFQFDNEETLRHVLHSL